MLRQEIERIARVCHEVNRAYCASLGDLSQPAWEEAPEWQRSSAVKGVEHHLSHPDSTPADSHNSWMEEKRAAGWKWGPVKDPAKKEHPCFVPYELLSADQKAKDFLFIAVVRALSASPARPSIEEKGRDHIMQFFAYQHLPEHLQRVSAPFGTLAEDLAANVPRNPECTVALRKLLEAKDAAVRAVLARE